MDERTERRVRERVEGLIRSGVSPQRLHGIVDQVAHGVYCNALAAEQRERHRADAVTVERDNLATELADLRERVAALVPIPAETQETKP